MNNTSPLSFLLCGFALSALPAFPAGSPSDDVDIYTPENVGAMTAKLDSKGTPFASESLKKYDKHYTMLAYRTATGSSEVHEHEADVFIIQSGSGALLKGGKLVGSKTTAEGELRGSSILGGTRVPVSKGDIIHIPAGVPHQLLIDKGSPISYFVIKVTGQ